MFCWVQTTLALAKFPKILLAYFIPQSLIGGIIIRRHKDSI